MLKQMISGEKYTTEELNARLKFFIGIVLGLTLFGIVFVVLYSLIFVTQPMNGMSPVDNKFFELIIPIATFLTGTLSGIMLAGGDKDLQAKAIDAASGVNRPGGLPPTRPTLPPTTPPSGMMSGGITPGITPTMAPRPSFEESSDDEPLFKPTVPAGAAPAPKVSIPTVKKPGE